ncbi:MAG TPA: NUDIX domain-containing protein [Vicinamibacterales bacterium]|nr:NUDIX domain-containing protein [Vicinamibacterales bacterium]
MSGDHLDRVRDFVRAFNAADATALGRFYADACETDGVPLKPAPSPTVQRSDAIARELQHFFEQHEGALDGGMFLRIRTLARLETGRGWVHAEWVGGLRERAPADGRHEAHLLTGYTHFYLGPDGRIEQQRSVVQPAGDDAAPDLPAPPPPSRGSRRYPSRPIVGVGAVIFVGSEVVLIKRRFEPLAGQWSLPGGTLEVGETLEAGTAREILEETGLAVDVGPVIEVFDRILLDEHRKVRYHFVLIDYLCRPVGGQLQHGSDVADVVLADPERLEQFGLTPKATAIIRKAAEMLRREGWPEPRKELL